MNTTIKILSGITILLMILVYILYNGFHAMDIEDRYGDLQDVYFKTVSGDSIVNNLNQKRGEILLENNRVFVLENQQKLELEKWLDPNSEMRYDLDVYDKEEKELSKLHIAFEY